VALCEAYPIKGIGAGVVELVELVEEVEFFKVLGSEQLFLLRCFQQRESKAL